MPAVSSASPGSGLTERSRHTVRNPKARLIPTASALASLAAIDAYMAAMLYTIDARSKVRDGKDMGESAVRENGGGKGRWYPMDKLI